MTEPRPSVEQTPDKQADKSDVLRQSAGGSPHLLDETDARLRVNQVETQGGPPLTNETMANEVAQRRRAEAELQDSKDRLAGIIDSAMDAIITIDVAQRITLFNAAAEKMFRCPAAEAIGQPLDRFIPERFRDAHRSHVEGFGRTRVTKRTMGSLGAVYGLRASGEEFPAEASISQLESGGRKFYTVILRDISEKRKLETQFLRAQRMESIGTLAGGIAHDLNNILAPILMAVQMLELKVTDDSSRRMLELLRANTERGSSMVKQILSFARGVSGERVIVQPKHLIKEIVKILKETFPKSVTIRFKIADDLWVINGDATQLHQVLMNLCVNARDAMPAGGTLTIESENTVVDETYAEMMLSARPGRYVRISIADTGGGIAPEHLNQIFDPFFTTKEVGQGTGLGLATVLGILKSHDGFVNVYSEIGKGAQFTLYLPASEAAALQPAQVAVPGIPAGRGELILVVDDEQAIREITKVTLEAFNYRALIANDGAQAVALFARHAGEVNAVLTDMMMPVMDGAALTIALRSLDPQIKIIASSGHYTEGKMAEATSAGVNAFLPKPYTADKLLKTLAEVLCNNKN